MQTFAPRDYLRIDIANNFGLDKKNWDERLAWFTANEHQLPKLLKQADTPALYFASVQSWQDINNGVPSGYPVSLDACSSGLQLLACLTNDYKAAQLCGLVNTGKREDAYTSIFETMLDELEERTKIDRDMIKQAVMTALYGSEQVPKDVFGEGSDLLRIFYEVMARVAPLAWELNQFFLQIWDTTVNIHSWVMPDNFHVHVRVMAKVTDRFHYNKQPFDLERYENAPIEKGRSLGANTTHSVDGMVVREMGRRCDYDLAQITFVRDALETCGRDTAAEHTGDHMDKDTEMVLTLWENYQASGFLSMRIVNHLNEMNARYVNRGAVLAMLATLPKKPFKILTVHDCFRCLPAYGNDLRMQYNTILADIARSKMLSYLLSQIMQREIEVAKPDYCIADDILEADYALS